VNRPHRGLLRVALLGTLLGACTSELAREERGGMESLPPDLIDQVITPFNRGVALMDRYQPAEAAEAFAEVVRVAPDWITGRLNYGIALLNAQNDTAYARAEVELESVLEMDPDNPSAHFALGMLFVYFTRADEARDEFEEVLRIDPDDADAHFQLGVLLTDDDPDSAERHFEATLAALPHHESAAYRLATLRRRQGNAEGGRDLLLRFQALKAAGAGVFAGMKYGEMGRYANIVRAFDNTNPPSTDDTPPAFVDEAEARGLSSIGGGGTPGRPGRGATLDAGRFGPGVAVADVNGDGELDVYLPGASPDDRGSLLLASAGGFDPVDDSGIDGRNGVGAFFGDYDADGDPDLFLTRAGPDRLYRNDGGRFVDVTAESGIVPGSFLSVGAAWADADHDGDLDLYVAHYAPWNGGGGTRGAPNALWRNNGDGRFTEVAAESGIDGGPSPTVSVLYFDFDDDRDLDLYLINDGTPNRLFLNDRVGVYREATGRFGELADSGAGLGALTGDVDGNGEEDLLLLRGSEPPRLWLHAGRSRYVEDESFRAWAEELGGAGGGVLQDLDLDGDLDLVLLDGGENDATAHRVAMNLGGGHFGAPVALGEENTMPTARGAVAADLDADGSLEILVARAGLSPELWRAPPTEGNHWLRVRPRAGEEIGGRWTEPEAPGLRVEVKAGRQLRVASLATSSGYLGSPPLVAHFGLGREEKADYVRLSWSDAVLQSEIEVPADQDWSVAKMSRKPSSCPMLFAWDGERFAFVTDFLGVGGLGFFSSPGEYSPPDPTEDVRIPPELIAEREGRYLLRVAEPLEEVTYLDELHLVAYDHPSAWEIHPDERFTGSAPFPTGAPYALAERVFPLTARDRDGADLLPRLRTVDRRYAEPPKRAGLVGYAEDHWVELDFGDRLSRMAEDGRVILYLYGWVEYTYSHVNYAAWQAGLRMESPRIEVPDRRGGWRVAVPEMGFPAGLPRMMTFDISDLARGGDGRLRIRTNMEIFWDQIFAAVDVTDARLRRRVLRPAVAELRPLGYPREYSPDGADPTLYDYQRLDAGLPFKNLTGNFTRFGDVRALLREVDDRFVIIGRGEEIALEFDASSLPELPPGWSRTLVLHSDGYTKDMDLYTAFPETVDPLPYHGMDGYPPRRPRPASPGFERYLKEWNTRRIVGG
jgi:Tfp pilus assembly protein PilF